MVGSGQDYLKDIPELEEILAEEEKLLNEALQNATMSTAAIPLTQEQSREGMEAPSTTSEVTRSI